MGWVPFMIQNQSFLILGNSGVPTVKKVSLKFGPQRCYSSQKSAPPGVQNSLVRSSKLNDANRVIKVRLELESKQI